MPPKKPTSVDEYIGGYNKDVQQILQQVRATIQQAAPAATEAIKYAMPTFILHGNLVFFAAFKNHIGLYALPSGHAAFTKALAHYKSGKGSVQFPLNKAMPLKLITQIVKYRVAENLQKINSK